MNIPRFTPVQGCILELSGAITGLLLTLYAQRFHGPWMVGLAAFFTLWSLAGALICWAKIPNVPTPNQKMKNNADQMWADMLKKEQ